MLHGGRQLRAAGDGQSPHPGGDAGHVAGAVAAVGGGHGGRGAGWVGGLYNDLLGREPDAAGLAFSNVQETVRETSDVIPLDLARKLRATERANLRLQSRLDQFLSEL